MSFVNLNRQLPGMPVHAFKGSDSPKGTGRKRAAAAKDDQPAASTSQDPQRKMKKAKATEDASEYAPPQTRLRDLGGIDSCIEKVLEMTLALQHPEVYRFSGVRPPRGILLAGPPGCGKTMLAGALAGELNVPFVSVSAPSIVSGMSGESEKTLRDIFDKALSLAPCILFIDEIDAITPKRENAQREMERRIVAQLLTCLDDLDWDKTDSRHVVVMGATNRPDALDPALRRAGRFDAEIAMGVPDEHGRESILRVILSKLRLAGSFDFAALARATPGYVGADLHSLASAAGVLAVKRVFEIASSDMRISGDGVSGVTGVNGVSGVTGVTGVDGVDGASGIDGAGGGQDVHFSNDHGNNQDADALPNSSRDVPMSIDENKPMEDACATPGTAPPQPQSNGEPSGGAQSSVGTQSSVPVSGVADESAPPERDPPLSTLPASLSGLPIVQFLQRHMGQTLTEAELEPLALTNDDFQQALGLVQASSMREGFTMLPDVSWSDLGALNEVRDELRMSIVQPIRSPELFVHLGIASPSGVLLWGPPGCGKTLLAKAVANESKANFMSVKGPELLNKYVGESERAVRQAFARARASSPCIIFFDELDALVPKRDDAMSESSARVVNTLLTELDGLEARKQVFVIGATNRPDMLDPAMCRPGRLDKLLFVDLPTPDERVQILQARTRATPLAPDVDLYAIAHHPRVDGFSGADLTALIREAAVVALREAESRASAANARILPDALQIYMRHFLLSVDRVSPSVSPEQRVKFAMLHDRLRT